jgi:hypothetical protein
MPTYRTYTETYDPQVYHFTMDCSLKDIPHACQAGEVIDIPGEDLFRFNQGTCSIQEALPTLTADQREWFGQTGFCPAGFAALFAEDES